MEIKTIDDLMDRVVDATIRRDLVLTLIKQAWDLGFDEGCEAKKHEIMEGIEAFIDY